MTASWEEMVRASAFSFLGLSYVRIVLSKGRRAIYLPLFVERFEEMAQLICHHAGAAHPVARELQKLLNSSDLS